MTLGLFDFLGLTTDRAAAAAELADLTDAELIQRFPLLTATAAVLLLLGVIADLWLLWRGWRDRSVIRSRLGGMPWGFHELGLLVVAYVSLNFLLLLGAHFVRGTEDAAWLFILVGNMAISLVLLAGMAAFFRRRALEWRALFGLEEPFRRRGARYGVIFFFAMIPPLYLVSGVSTVVCQLIDVETGPQPIVELLTLTDSTWVIGLVALMAAVVAPVFEEVMFRGVAYPAMKQRWGTWPAVLVVSLLFAGVHLHAGSIGPLFALGAMFALAYELTGSLATPILMHALFNTANVVMLLYVRLHA